MFDIIGSHLNVKRARRLIKAGKVIKAARVPIKTTTLDRVVVYPGTLTISEETSLDSSRGNRL